MRRVEIVPYDQNWPKFFESEAIFIGEILGNNCVEIYHIGSTSVPDLAAKPTIDIMPVVQDIKKVDKYNSAMVELGYEPKGEFGIALRRYFQKIVDLPIANTHTHHVHIYEQGNPEIIRHIKFRDWMHNNQIDRDAYAKLKIHLAKKFPNDITSYCLGKNEFISSINSKTGWNDE